MARLILALISTIIYFQNMVIRVFQNRLNARDLSNMYNLRINFISLEFFYLERKQVQICYRNHRLMPYFETYM